MPYTAWAADGARRPLAPIRVDPTPLGPDEVEVAVETCGICHSDLSMLDNEWGMSAYPFVPGHEVVGRVVAVGEHAKGLRPGQRVGIGWTARSCMACRACLAGDHHLCTAAQGTIVGRHGGFAERVRAHWAWTIPLPDGLDAASAGPLLCGGITVFTPLLAYRVPPTARVGVVGIGGLGHLALRFARAWGCEVVALTSTASKTDEALKLGAHRVVVQSDATAMQALAGSIDLLIVTANVPLAWDVLLGALAPHGRLHLVGAVLQPIPVPAFALIMGQRSVSGSPTGSPTGIATMLDFAARHRIAPTVERFPLAKVNDALEHLRAGKARYRIVLDV